MKLLLPFFYVTCIVLLMTVVSSCSSTGYSGYSGGASYYHRNSWDYDNYYRSGVNRHYNRSATRANVRSTAGSRSGAARAGAAARSGGGRGGGGRR
ncbi:MAG: hypothetical protein ACR2PB_05960 [Desulfocapsaceae bacterium]